MTREQHTAAPDAPSRAIERSARGDEAWQRQPGTAVNEPASRLPWNAPSILRLQSTHGNAHVQRLLCERRVVQPLAPASSAPRLQRTIGDGHDLASPRFAGEPRLESCFDDEDRLTMRAQGAPVRKVQEALIELKFNVGPRGADGDFGPATRDAVKKFKKDKGLGFEQIGDVGPGTMAKLDSLLGGGGGGGGGNNAAGPVPFLDQIQIIPRRQARSTVSADPGEFILTQAESPQIDSSVAFVVTVNVAPNHVGRLFFRQFALVVIRKEKACGRPPKGVNMQPALDSRSEYNNPPTTPIGTGPITVPGGAKRTVGMADGDSPFQGVNPGCAFKQGDKVTLKAQDEFRLLVIWKTADGTETALGHRDWGWDARGTFEKIDQGIGEASWRHGLTEGSGPRLTSTVSRPGVEPATKEVIADGRVMDGATEVDDF